MNFDYAIARRLYDQAAHPRMLLGAEDLPRLRRRLATGIGRKMYNVFRERTRPAIAALDDVPIADDRRLKPGQPHAPGYQCALGRATDLAFIGLVDGEAAATAVVQRILPLCARLEGGEAQARHRLGCRAGGLAVAYDLIAGGLDEADRRTICRWFYKSGVIATLANLLPAFYMEAGRNIPMNQLFSALLVMLAIDGEPGVPSLAGHWQEALRMFDATLHTVVGVDGFPSEDTGYGTSMMARTMYVGEMLRRAGKLDPWQAAPRYAKFGQAVLHLVQPWGEHLTTTGDHGDDFGNREFPLARLAEETKDPSLLWLSGTLCYPTRGASQDLEIRPNLRVPVSIQALLCADLFVKGKHPKQCAVPTAYRDRERGVVCFRSSWDPDATHLFFDGSERNNAAQGHEHASSGHFCLSALGDYFAIGPGRYGLEQKNQSVVLVNGQSGRDSKGEWCFMKQHGCLTEYAPNEFVDSAAADSSHQHDCYWAFRSIGLVKGKGAPAYVWTLDDINACNDWAEYWWQLQLSPESRIALTRKRATITGWRSGNHLDVHVALPAPKDYARPHAFAFDHDEVLPSSTAYISAAEYRKRAKTDFARPSEQIHWSTFVHPRLLAKVEGLNGRFATLLLPRRKGEAAAKVKRLKSVPGTIAVEVDFGDVIDTLVWCFDNSMLIGGDVDGRGKWCVVRRRPATGRIVAWQLHQGTRLSVAGKPLVC